MTATSFPFEPRYQFYDEQGNVKVWTNPILHRFLHDLWSKTGGGSNFVKPPITITPGDVTTTKDQVIIATAELTVALNATPKDGEKVIVKRTFHGGVVTVSGAIDGGTFFKMLLKNDSYTFCYSLAQAEWYIT